MKTYHLTALVCSAMVLGCGGPEKKTMGSIEALDPSFNDLIGPDAKVEVLADGLDWSEGPLWLESSKQLLFSDIPRNEVNAWSEQDGVQPYLKPSGFTGTTSSAPEPGSNGLLLDRENRLLLCQHGDRRIAMMDAPLDNPSPVFKTIADRYDSMRFNSPNDAAMSRSGEIYFTDPPYGLPQQSDDDPSKELPFNGVYKIKTDGTVLLLVDTITRPNGIGLSPDEKYLYVANSDPVKKLWYRFEIAGDSLTDGKIFYRVSPEEPASSPGLPDGLKVDSGGNLFATGPGGLWVLSPDGVLLGRIHLPQATANCAFGNGGKALYLTSDAYLLRVQLR